MARKSLGRFLRRLFRRSPQTAEAPPPIQHEPRGARPKEKQKQKQTHAARPTQRESDIPMDVIDRAYTPPITSSKASFRSDGSDKQRDQELIPGTVDERWNDEDRLTNKTGDPRIGTHGRKYESDDVRSESRK